MHINTRYELGQEVYTVVYGGMHKANIDRIETRSYRMNGETYTEIRYAVGGYTHPEHEVFGTYEAFKIHLAIVKKKEDEAREIRQKKHHYDNR